MPSATARCPCPNAGECSHASKLASSRHRVITSQVVRPSVGLSSSKPSKPSWLSTAPARAANRRASSSPLSAGTVMALIFTTDMCPIMPAIPSARPPDARAPLQPDVPPASHRRPVPWEHVPCHGTEGGTMPAGNLSPRPLGSAGMDVSALSLGSWRTVERLPPETGVAILRAARDEGITFFDDARYNDETGQAPIPTGYSEVLFGELFRGAGLRRDETVVANKLWWEFWPGQGAAAELDASLQRMGFDHVDLIYANPPPAGLEVADLVAGVGALVAAGKARAWGLVNWPADLCGRAVEAAEGLAIAPPCAVQLPYSLVQRSWVEDAAMKQAVTRAGAGVIASFCLAGGVLTGKYRFGAAAGRLDGALTEPRYVPAIAAAGELAGLAESLHTTAAALALAFPFTNPDVASVLFGATSAGQLRANCAAAALWDRLGPDDIAALLRIGLPAGTGSG